MLTLELRQWDNEAHARLCVALADALESAGSSTFHHKNGIMAVMGVGSQPFTWEAIR